MRLPFLDATDPFPDTSQAWPDGSDAPGLLAAGGDLGTERLRTAYSRGIFPWYSKGQPILWWTPDPRMVLKVDDFKISLSFRKTLRKTMKSGDTEIRVDHDFGRVIQACAETPRQGQPGTWILPEMIRAYRDLNQAGLAHSVETWVRGELAGGLYLINLGRMVFGESMFAWQTDASKIALAALVALCRREGVRWIDCQQQTEHLARFGASPVPRDHFEAHLAGTVNHACHARWSFSRADWAELNLTPVPPDADN